MQQPTSFLERVAEAAVSIFFFSSLAYVVSSFPSVVNEVKLYEQKQGEESTQIPEETLPPDLVQTLTAIVDETGEQLFTLESMIAFFEAGGDVDYAQRLALCTDSNDNLYFRTAAEFVEFATLKIPASYVEELVGYYDTHGQSIFSREHIRDFFIAGATTEFAQTLFSIVGDDNNLLFTDGATYVQIVNSDISIAAIHAYAALENQEGDSLFQDGSALVSYILSEKGMPYLDALMELQDKHGRYIFTNGEHIAHFVDAEGRIDDVKNIVYATTYEAKNGFPDVTPYEIWRYAQLQIPPSEISTFHDTAKPNAIIILPVADYNGALENSYATALIKNIRERYDTAVSFHGVDHGIHEFPVIPNPVFGLFAGHGDGQRLRLGNFDSSSSFPEEAYYLDVSDEEMRDYLTQFTADAHIFLFSCSAAREIEGETNLATRVAHWAQGRRVFASTAPFTARTISLQSVYPFDVVIQGLKEGELWVQEDTTSIHMTPDYNVSVQYPLSSLYAR